MKLNTGTRNFWFQVGMALLWGLVFGGGFFWVNGQGEMAVAIGAVVFLMELFLFLKVVKAAMVQGLPDWEFRPINPEESYFLNLPWFQQQTQALEALGFVPLQDYLVPPFTTAIARCFAHPEQYCFAEIGQLTDTSDCPTPEGMDTHNLVIFSRFDQGWKLSDVQGNPKPTLSLAILWHNPKHIGRYHPNASVADLMETHLRFRHQILTDLKITVSTDVSWDAFNQDQMDSALDRRARLKRQSLVHFLIGMIQATQIELNPSLEWLGDYQRTKNHRRH